MSDIATADWSWVNAAAERFKRLQAGPPPAHRRFPGGSGPAAEAALLDELLRVELELRRRAGDAPEPNKYRGRFPDFPAVVGTVFGVVPVDRRRSESAPRRTFESSTNTEGQGGDSFAFHSTNADSPSPRGAAAFRLWPVSEHDAPTHASQQVLGSTITAPSDGARPATPARSRNARLASGPVPADRKARWWCPGSRLAGRRA